MLKKRGTCKAAIENALGYVPEAAFVKQARATYRGQVTTELRREVKALATL